MEISLINVNTWPAPSSWHLELCSGNKKKSEFISTLIIWKWKMWTSKQRGWYWSFSCRHKSQHWAAGPTGNGGGETGRSMSMMEPLVTQWPWRGLIVSFLGFVWKVGLLMLGNRAVVMGDSWRHLCGRSVDISDAGFLTPAAASVCCSCPLY